MKTILALIGFVFIGFSIIGAAVPGFNFHVCFGPDKGCRDWHAKQAEMLDLKMEIEARGKD